MSSRYDRDYDRGGQEDRRRSRQEYGGSYGERSESMYGYAGEPEAEKYTRHLGSDRNRFAMGSSDEYRRNRGEYGGGREGYWGGGWENEHDERSRYGNPIGGSGFERGYNQSRNDYSQRYNNMSNYRSGERSGRYGERDYDYDRDRDRWGRGNEWRDDRYDRGNEGRGWLDRASDAVASWFGDEEAERRRRMDDQRQHRGRGPKGYRRSDERIKEDVNDRLGDDYYLDASDVEVAVENTEVTLTGTVRNRSDKRRAEDIAESVSGVTNVENRLRVKQQYDYSTSGTSITDTSNTTGTTTSSAAAGGGTTTRGRTT
jgi:osmotically-inducible protein OsmY